MARSSPHQNLPSSFRFVFVFTKEWDFEHRTNSPGDSKANGKMESAIKTAMNLTRKALDSRTDPYIAILDYCNTPTQGLESSPVQRLMNGRTRTLLQTTKPLLPPRTPQADREMKDLINDKHSSANPVQLLQPTHS